MAAGQAYLRGGKLYIPGGKAYIGHDCCCDESCPAMVECLYFADGSVETPDSLTLVFSGVTHRDPCFFLPGTAITAIDGTLNGEFCLPKCSADGTEQACVYFAKFTDVLSVTADSSCDAPFQPLVLDRLYIWALVSAGGVSVQVYISDLDHTEGCSPVDAASPYPPYQDSTLCFLGSTAAVGAGYWPQAVTTTDAGYIFSGGTVTITPCCLEGDI